MRWLRPETRGGRLPKTEARLKGSYGETNFDTGKGGRRCDLSSFPRAGGGREARTNFGLVQNDHGHGNPKEAQTMRLRPYHYVLSREPPSLPLEQFRLQVNIRHKLGSVSDPSLLHDEEVCAALLLTIELRAP